MTTTTITHRCSLRQHLRIEQTSLAAWHSLAPFHYRNGEPRSIDRVFALFSDDNRWHRHCGRSDLPVGVIVLTMPLPRLAMRNIALNHRYDRLLDAASALTLLNQEVRCISRVVVHPQFRGLGLACDLVRHALSQAAVPFVEAMAVMGKVNPFFARAGMTAYPARRSDMALRLSAAFDFIGVDETLLGDSTAIAHALARCDPEQFHYILAALRRFAHGFPHCPKHIRAPNDPVLDDAERTTLIDLVVTHALSEPVYYLYCRPTS